MNTIAQMRQPTIYDTTERICVKHDPFTFGKSDTETEANIGQDSRRCAIAVLAYFVIVISVCCMYIFIKWHS